MHAPARSAPALTPHAAALSATALRPMHRFTPADAPRILSHLLGLDADDRLLRFSHGIRDEGIATYVAALDFARDQVHGLCAAHGDIVALAHAGLSEGSLDFGLSVSPAYRKRGLGRALFGHVIALAHALRAPRIICLSTSPAVLHMATASGFRRPGGRLTAPLTLALQPGGYDAPGHRAETLAAPAPLTARHAAA